MYRDPSEFRERFKAYKEGKSVREIYGLPEYVGGKSSSAVDDTADFLRLYEGFKEKTYLDGKGIPTIGYGFTDAKFVNKGKITRAEAEVELKRQIAVRLAELRRKLGPLVWDSLSNDSKKALTSYHFNYPAGFKDNTRFMLYWRAGRYADAIKEVDAGWNDPNNPGLRTRRIAELKLLRNDPALFQRPVSEKPSDVIILRPDALRVTTIPTIQQQAIDYSDHRNSFAAEAERAIWARNVMDSLQEGYKVPVWESPSLPALLPVEMDVVPFKTYSSGKLPGYLGGKEATIQQGRKQLPIDKAEAATEPDYNEGWLLTTLKRGANNFIKTVKDQVRSARNIVNGRGDWFDWLNVGTDVVLGAGGKAVKGAAKEAKAAAKAIKPKKSSVKFNTKDPNKVGAYYTAHPEEVTPITNSEELKDVVNFMNTHIAPKYARQNKVHIGIDPADIKLGSADLSGTNLGGYVGPSGEVVINQDILNNSDLLRRVLGHEVAGHWFDLHYPLTPAQASIVLNGVRFNADFLNSRPWFDLFAEGNAERRLFNYLSSRDNGNVVGSELDAIINSMPRAQAKRYADMLGYNKGIEWQWPDILPFKQAATSVPTIGIPLYAGTQIDRQYKNGKLPGYKIGHNPSNAKMNSDGTFTDDYTKVFEDMYVTPKKVDLKYGSHTLNNFPEYLANRTAWMLTFIPQSVLNDKPLEQPAIDPFLLLITGGRFSGDLTGDVIEMGLDKALKIAINSAVNAARVAAKTPVGKRTVETIMRTSSNPTPFDKIKNGVKTFDKNRSKAVLNYILTGKRTGDFGYYNSFAENPELAYTGFVSERLKKYALDLDEANIMLHNPSSEYGDAIDAYLYNKQIDPVYGFDLVSIGNDFGPHGQYILLNYNKVSKNIPVYESPVLTIEIRVPRSQTSQVKSIENIGDEGYIRGAYSNRGNVEYDAAGHLKQLGTFANVPMARELDIWKYLPSDYNKYTTDLKGIRKALQYIGTNAVDAAGTPIIVRTPWQYYPKYSGEFINKIAGYKDGKIRIKPANRGKFNATKKRTGKTTEELTHSKNPLTRKRAIFALNARKWDHK